MITEKTLDEAVQRIVAQANPRRVILFIEREGDGYVSTCQELDIVSQGRTIEEARLNLVEAVEGFLEAASASEIRRRLKTETYIMPATRAKRVTGSDRA